MTERVHGFGFGKFLAGFIGIVAMAALITGAVAASNGPHHVVVPADPADTALATHVTGAASTATAEIHETEGPSSEETAKPSVAPTSSPAALVKPGASCNPSLDNKEDVSDSQTADQNGDNDDQAPNAAESPAVSPIPEPSELPKCLMVDPDSHGDQTSGKTDQASVGTSSDGPGHSWGGDSGSTGGLPDKGNVGLPPKDAFGH